MSWFNMWTRDITPFESTSGNARGNRSADVASTDLPFLRHAIGANDSLAPEADPKKCTIAGTQLERMFRLGLVCENM